MNIQRVENMAGGKGHVIIKHILGDKEMHENCRMYAEVTLEPGCSLGYHEHHGESETIISFPDREIMTMTGGSVR